ncbi:candidate protein kinase C [Mucor ambiguus]|uniref:protein kinase C n=1 Tax=Mucor ambiguus TaxID=91626 RepID=A0A0C9LUS1_9FUNG|nr:candidate protein kinase C [Mucor ambiguus]
MEELEARIKEVQAKIDQNTHLRKKAIELRQILKDRNAQLQCDTQIRESQRYIDYFTEELRRLQTKGSRASFISLQSFHQQQSNESSSSTDAMAKSTTTTSTTTPGSHGAENGAVLEQPIVDSPTQASLQSYFPNTTTNTSASTPTSEMAEEDPRKRYTNLDLLESDTPINRAKVSLKLHELEYKVDVEKKVQEGIRNLYTILDRTSASSAADRRRKAELHEKQLECSEKMTLLNNSVKKYKDLYLGEEDEEDEDESGETLSAEAAAKEEEKLEQMEARPVLRGMPGARRPVTGKLQLKIVEAHELAHAPTRMFRDPLTAVMVKIDGNIQFRTRPSKNDKWTDSFEMHVDKATEVELLIYDQSGDRTLPIGLLWLKISDIAENLRKQKLELEQHGSNWVPAQVAQQHHDAPLDVAQHKNDAENKRKHAALSEHGGINAWFDVEPLGRIYLEINFVRENVKRRPMDKLGRAGAVRERKGEVHEMNGHQFVARRFYHIMKCALCGDFMAKLTFQCEDCGLACHKKCYTRVVTRCISRADSKLDHDEDELKHRIPHRFEPLTIIGANWCCHCGFMLPLGFRGAQKCAECGVVCHTKCAELVPDFCGMSMEKANLMLSEMKAANNRRRTFHSDSLPHFSSDNHQRPLFASSSSNTQQQQQQQAQTVKPYKQESNNASIISPQSSFSTPVSPKINPTASRPLSMNHDTSSFQSLTHLFSQQNSISDTLSRAGTHHITTPVQVNRKVGLDDFNLLAVLGKGNFGKVMLAEEKYTNELYAIKILKKRFVLDNDEVESTRSEKRVFLAANEERHPFLVNLHSTFQTETRIYYVMEYVSGGDLMLQIQREQFSEARARFYACEVLLALDYFHKHGIIYRDLKLDNIMLCLDGHIKLADYGLCKENMWANNTTNTFCGTPEFMAPEILLEHRYGRAVDWWAFGVLLYEMLLGQSPFKGEDEDEIFDAVLEDNILYPINMSKHSVSICEALLERNPEKRLGGGKGDAQEVKNHPFFAGVNWDDMLAKRVQPPFLPTVNGRADTSNFDEEFTREIPILTPVNAMLTANEQQEFSSFSYVANWAIDGTT